MSILTKICVVVLLVLILLACPVFITQATVAPNWRYRYDQEKLHRERAEADIRSGMVANSALIAELNAAREGLDTAKASKQQEIDRLTTELATWQTRAVELQNNLERLTTEVAGLKSEARTFNKRNEMLSTGLDSARQKIDKLTKEVIRVSDLLKQAEAEKDRLDKIARVRYERIRELEEELEGFQRTGAAPVTDVQVLAPTTAERITGSITAVRGDYASINVGSAKGIKRGMKLVIYRGAQLVAFLRVDEVDVGQAAGIIVDRQLDPVSGDKVTNKLLD